MKVFVRLPKAMKASDVKKCIHQSMSGIETRRLTIHLNPNENLKIEQLAEKERVSKSVACTAIIINSLYKQVIEKHGGLINSSVESIPAPVRELFAQFYDEVKSEITGANMEVKGGSE